MLFLVLFSRMVFIRLRYSITAGQAAGDRSPLWVSASEKLYTSFSFQLFPAVFFPLDLGLLGAVLPCRPRSGAAGSSLGGAVNKMPLV